MNIGRMDFPQGRTNFDGSMQVLTRQTGLVFQTSILGRDARVRKDRYGKEIATARRSLPQVCVLQERP